MSDTVAGVMGLSLRLGTEGCSSSVGMVGSSKDICEKWVEKLVGPPSSSSGIVRRQGLGGLAIVTPFEPVFIELMLLVL